MITELILPVAAVISLIYLRFDEKWNNDPKWLKHTNSCLIGAVIGILLNTLLSPFLFIDELSGLGSWSLDFNNNFHIFLLYERNLIGAHMATVIIMALLFFHLYPLGALQSLLTVAVFSGIHECIWYVFFYGFQLKIPVLLDLMVIFYTVLFSIIFFKKKYKMPRYAFASTCIMACFLLIRALIISPLPSQTIETSIIETVGWFILFMGFWLK